MSRGPETPLPFRAVRAFRVARAPGVAHLPRLAFLQAPGLFGLARFAAPAPPQHVQPAHELLELAPTDRRFLLVAFGAVDLHVGVAVLLRHHPRPYTLMQLHPRLVRQLVLQLVERGAERAHQVAGPAVAHLLQDLFGGDTAVHHPHSPRLAVQRFDLGQEVAQRGLVTGVADQDLVRQRQAVGRHHQGDHHLPAVLLPIAVVPELALGDLGALPFEVGAGQVVEQHVELGVEQRPPALGEEPAQRLLVLQQPVQAAVQAVLARDGKVHLQQLVHGAAVEPLAVQAELAARGDQPVHHQQLQHLHPRHRLAPRRQQRLPELREPQLLPHQAAEPAVPVRARPQQLHLRKLHRDRVRLVRRQRPVVGEQTHLAELPAVLVEHTQRPAPGRLLAVVDLPEVHHLPLRRLPVGQAAVLHHAEITVTLPILLPLGGPDEHADVIAKPPAGVQEGRSSPQRFCRPNPRWRTAIAEKSSKIAGNPDELRRLG